MGKMWEFRFVCPICTKVIQGLSNQPLDENHTSWYRGFVCKKCYTQTNIERFIHSDSNE